MRDVKAKTGKKLLLAAVAAAVLGTSGSAMALTFSDGALNGTMNITGTLTVPVATNQWQWAAGDALTFPDSVSGSMTNSYKTLTLPMAQDTTLLVGQTKAASPGGVGITPSIALTDAGGNAITPVWGSGGNGKGTITLPMVGSDGTTALGNVLLNVTAVGVVASILPNGQVVNSTVYNDGSSNIFGNAIPSSAAGVISQLGDANIAMAGRLGSTVTLLNQLTAVDATKTAYTNRDAGPYSLSDPNVSYAGQYGLGIVSGDSIVLNFTNAVNTTTAWQSKLNMKVTYL